MNEKCLYRSEKPAQCLKYHECSHLDKAPGFRLCVQERTCPLKRSDHDGAGNPEIGTRWKRKTTWYPELGVYNGYTVVGITNLGHRHEDHPPQVVYIGDNGLLWSLELDKWPGSLTEESKDKSA